MMEQDANFTLTLEEWRALNKRQGQFETDLATTNATLSAQGQILQEIRGDVRSLASRVNQPTPRSFWINVVMMILGTGTVLGAIGLLAITPIRNEATQAYEERREVNDRLIERGRELAHLSEATRWLEVLALRNLDSKDNSLVLQGEIEALRQQIQAIDDVGSRVDVQKRRFVKDPDDG